MTLVDVILNTIVFALILSFLVLIHELGHFLAARWQKIRVEEFGLGYPPRAKTLFIKWHTIFSLNWVPFGGFVRMEGEDALVTEEPIRKNSKKKQLPLNEEGPFYEKSAVARLIVILAGAIVNVLFGILAFAVVFSFMGIPAGVRVNEVEPNSPGAQADLTAGQVITQVVVDDAVYPLRSTGELVALTGANLGKSITLTTQEICDQGLCPATQTIEVTLRSEVSEKQGAIGIKPEDFSKFYPWYEMPLRGAWFGLVQAVTLGVLILQSLATMISDLVTRAIVPQEVMGPVGIVHEAARQDLVSQGPLAILLFAGLISINLGIMNVLPIPALDGGRAVFILLEKILGKAKVQQVENYANYGGYAVLLGLIFLITARDVFRIVTGG